MVVFMHRTTRVDLSILEQQTPAEMHKSYGNWNEMPFFKWAVDSLALLSPRNQRQYAPRMASAHVKQGNENLKVTLCPCVL